MLSPTLMRPLAPPALALALAFLGAGLAACGDDEAPPDAGTNHDALPGDAAPDAGIADLGLDAALGDGGRPDAAGLDVGFRDVGTVDAGPGSENLIGTSLEGITIEWDEPLELCTRWMENAPLEDELARKVHITLPPHFRPSLGDGHLASLTLDAGRVRRSPLAVDQLEVAEHLTRSRLTEYTLREPNGNTSLFASIDHELDDGAILVEQYNVYRQRGDTRPVRFESGGYEAAFAYIPASVPNGGLSLERCGGEPELEPQIGVISLRNGERRGTALRQYRSTLSFAGSYPVQLETSIFVFSDRPWQQFRAAGFWAHTYSAQHHNWFEDTLVDFTRDLGWYETVYEPYLDGRVTTDRMLLRARTLELNAWEVSPRAELEWLDLATGQVSTETWTVESGGFWHQVEAKLLAGMTTACAQPEVLSFTDYGLERGLQLVTCPSNDALGFVVHRAVPFSFFEEPTLVGAYLEGEDLVATTIDGRPGYVIHVGQHRVEISRSDAQYFFMTIKTAGGAVVSNFLTQPWDLHGYFDPTDRDELISGQGAGGVSMLLRRRWAGQGVGESSLYAPISFELSFGGQTHFVDTWDRLAYTNTHHNWMDELEARTDTLSLFWKVRFENGPLAHSVRAVVTQTGEEVLPETELELD